MRRHNTKYTGLACNRKTIKCAAFFSESLQEDRWKMFDHSSLLFLPIFIIHFKSGPACLCNATTRDSEMEVMVVAFGPTGPMALATLSRNTPVYELAVNDLARKYNGSLRFSYTLVPGKNCLQTAQREEDILAKGYYELRRPNRVLVFISPGFEPGHKEQKTLHKVQRWIHNKLCHCMDYLNKSFWLLQIAFLVIRPFTYWRLIGIPLQWIGIGLWVIPLLFGTAVNAPHMWSITWLHFYPNVSFSNKVAMNQTRTLRASQSVSLFCSPHTNPEITTSKYVTSKPFFSPNENCL